MSENIKDTIDRHIETYQEELDEALMEIKDAQDKKDTATGFKLGLVQFKCSCKIEALEELKKDLIRLAKMRHVAISDIDSIGDESTIQKLAHASGVPPIPRQI